MSQRMTINQILKEIDVNKKLLHLMVTEYSGKDRNELKDGEMFELETSEFTHNIMMAFTKRNGELSNMLAKFN